MSIHLLVAQVDPDKLAHLCDEVWDKFFWELEVHAGRGIVNLFVVDVRKTEARGRNCPCPRGGRKSLGVFVVAKLNLLNRRRKYLKTQSNNSYWRILRRGREGAVEDILHLLLIVDK